MGIQVGGEVIGYSVDSVESTKEVLHDALCVTVNTETTKVTEGNDDAKENFEPIFGALTNFSPSTKEGDAVNKFQMGLMHTEVGEEEFHENNEYFIFYRNGHYHCFRNSANVDARPSIISQEVMWATEEFLESEDDGIRVGVFFSDVIHAFATCSCVILRKNLCEDLEIFNEDDKPKTLRALLK